MARLRFAPRTRPLTRLVAAGLAAVAAGVTTWLGPIPGSGSPARAAGVNRVAGIDMPQGPTPTAAARLRSDGMDTVSLFVSWWADSPTSDTVHPYSGTESDDALVTAIHTAQAAGLRVVLSPIFYCGGCEGYWRGTMQPSDTSAFFDSYRAFIDHYAALAQANSVWMLFVGTEMTTLESYTTQWRQVISEARSAYQGLLAYEVNWDVLGQAHFLDALDVIGVSAYFPLDDRASPTVEELSSDWTSSHASATAGRDWVGAVTHLALSSGKPVIFGEVGYMATDYAGRQPFLNFLGQPNADLQSSLYQALLTNFDSFSWWMGALWWEWSGVDGQSDLRSPIGRPAETLLQRWYAQGWRPSADPSPPSTTPAENGPATATATPRPSAPATTPRPTGRSGTVTRPHPSAAGATGQLPVTVPLPSPLATAAESSRSPGHPLAIGPLARFSSAPPRLARDPAAVTASALLLAVSLIGALASRRRRLAAE